MNLDTTLGIVLDALQQDVLPVAVDGRAKTSLRSVLRVLAHLRVNLATREVVPAVDAPGFPGMNLQQQAELLRSALATAQRKDSPQPLKEHVLFEAHALRDLQAATESALAAMDSITTTPTSPDTQSTANALETYLRQRYSRDALRVTRFEPFAAGRSKVTAAVWLEDCPELPDRVVFRQDAALNATGGASIGVEFVILERLHTLGVTVPKPFLHESSPAPLGRSFMLMSHVEGTSAGEGLHFPASAEVARALAYEMGRLHSIPIVQFEDVLPPEPPPTREALLAELDQYEHTWKAYAVRPSFTMAYAIEWLRSHIELAFTGHRSLIHRDLMFHNVLARGDRLTAVVDWEFAKIGFAAEDLGWTRPVAEGVIEWREFMALYYSAGAPKLDSAHLDFYAVWSAVRLLAMLAQVDKLVDTGASRNIEYLCGAFHETQIVLQRLATLLAGLSDNG